jgi:hypothetical protein
MHSGASDPRELGRKSGESRRKPNPERVHQNLREYLRANVEPAEVWAALKLAMEGENESARVAASRVLMDALHEPEQDDQHQRQVEAAAAREKLARLLEMRASAAARADQRELSDVLDELASTLREEAVAEHPDLIVGDVTSEQAARVLQDLEETGLLVPRHRVETLAEEIAQERLLALKQEHGLA